VQDRICVDDVVVRVSCVNIFCECDYQPVKFHELSGASLCVFRPAFFADDGSSSADEVASALRCAPLPTYFTDARGAPTGLLDFGVEETGAAGSTSAEASTGASAIAAAAAAMDQSGTGVSGASNSNKPRCLPCCADADVETKVYWLGQGGVVMVGSMTVAFLSPGDQETKGLQKLEVGAMWGLGIDNSL
jgi:hypothetical protein